jgi:hypothetical protein
MDRVSPSSTVWTTGSTVGVAVGGLGVGVGVAVGWGVAAGGVSVGETLVPAKPSTAGSTGGIAATDSEVAGVTGVRVGRGVLVGKTIQATGLEAMVSKVGASVRVGRGRGRCCSANWVKAVLKMI